MGLVTWQRLLTYVNACKGSLASLAVHIAMKPPILRDIFDVTETVHMTKDQLEIHDWYFLKFFSKMLIWGKPSWDKDFS